MGAPELERLVRIEAGVDAPENHMRPAFAGHASHFVATQRISTMDPDADRISRANLRAGDWRERFVNERRVSKGTRGGSGKYVKPSGRNDAHAKRQVVRIDEMYAQGYMLNRARNPSQTRFRRAVLIPS